MKSQNITQNTQLQANLEFQDKTQKLVFTQNTQHMQFYCQDSASPFYSQYTKLTSTCNFGWKCS